MSSASSPPSSATSIGYCRDQSPPCARSPCRREHHAVARLSQRRAPAQRDPRGSGQAFCRRGDGRHFRRLQDRRLPHYRQRQGSLGAGDAAGLDLQDSEFGDCAGDRCRRRSRQGRFQMGRCGQKHRGLESRPHAALGDRRIRRAGLSGDRPAHRRGADAEIRRPVRIRQPRHRRRHRPILADRQAAQQRPASRRSAGWWAGQRRPARVRCLRSISIFASRAISPIA